MTQDDIRIEWIITLHEREKEYIVNKGLAKKEYTVPKDIRNRQYKDILKVLANIVDYPTVIYIPFASQTEQEQIIALKNTKAEKGLASTELYDKYKYRINFLTDEGLIRTYFSAKETLYYLIRLLKPEVYPINVPLTKTGKIVTIETKSLSDKIRAELEQVLSDSFQDTYFSTHLLPITQALNDATTIEEVNNITITAPPEIEIDLIGY